MNDRLLGWNRTFLVAWCGAIIAHFVYVQLKTDFGSTIDELEFSWTYLWHPYWFGVLNATLVIVPSLVFALPTAIRFGGWTSSIGRSIILLATGVSLWGLGNLFWFSQNVLGNDAPYPSLADAGYLAVLPFAAAALFELSRVVGLTGRDWSWLAIALLVAMPLNLYIMLPQSMLGAFLPDGMLRWAVEAGTFDTPLAAVISTTYIVSDVVLLAMSIVIALGARRAAGGRFFAPVLAVSASLAMLYVGDLFFNYRIAKDIFYNAEISDLLYGVFVVLASASAMLFLEADVRAKQQAAADDDDWEPILAPASSSNGADMGSLPPLDEIASAILRGQSRVMGEATATEIARSVPGITVDGAIATASSDAAIEQLVQRFRSISGPLGEMVCFTAAKPVLARSPDIRVPSFARFGSGQAASAPRSGSSTPPSPLVPG